MPTGSKVKNQLVGKHRLAKWIRPFVRMVLVGMIPTLKVAAQQERQNGVTDSLHIRNLAPIVIKSSSPVASRKGDTVVYDAARYRTAATFRLSALLNQMPGFRVDENGRIHYNGKEVSRVMIDGDDLTGERYNLLSAQLRAALIAKIQVIEKHQQNRLLRGVQPSEQLAINLVTEQKYWNKPSGSVGLTVGNRRQYRAESDAVWLSQSWKSMVFGLVGNSASPNQVATVVQDATSMPIGYISFQQADRKAVRPDAIPAHYRNISMDKGMQWIISRKLGQALKLRMIAEADRRKEQAVSIEERSFLFDDTRYSQLWQSGNFQSAKRSATIEMLYDGQGKRTARYRLDLAQHENPSEQLMQRSGYLPGELDELLQPLRLMWQIRQEEYFQLKKGVMLWEASFAGDSHRQILVALGAPVWQDFRHRGLLYQFHLGWVQQKGKRQLTAGMRAASEKMHSKINANALATAVIKVYPYLSWNYQFNKKWKQLMQLSAGTAGTQLAKRFGWYGIYHAEARTDWQPKPTAQYFLSVLSTQKVSEENKLFAGPLFAYPGIWWRSSETYAIPRLWQGQLGMVRMNLYTGLMMNVLLQATVTRLEQGMSLALGDSYQEFAVFKADRQTRWMAQMHLEQYIHAVHIRYTCQSNYTLSAQPQTVNGSVYATRISSIQMEQRISTHWKIPFNMVLHYGIRHGRYSMIRSNPARTLGLQQHTRMELAYRFGKRAVYQLHYAYTHLPNAALFHAFDVSANIQASSRWKFSVQALNLFNTRYYRILGIDQVSSFNHQHLLRGRSYLVGVQYGF
jgi:hypothetical protein